MKAYLIVWEDITHDAGWHSAEELNEYINDKKENIVTQLGFIYSQNEKMTIVVDSWIGELPKAGNLKIEIEDPIQYGVIHKIPTGCILKIQEVYSENLKT